MSRQPSPLNRHAMTLAAFALPALALTVPSGYSFSALLLCALGAVAWLVGPRLGTGRVH
jgi:hypothetical protein